jgi:hypothetical protein
MPPVEKSVALFREGFVATPVDAAYLVAADMAGRLPRVVARQGHAGGENLAASGTVVVCHFPVQDRQQRWKDTRKWTPRRTVDRGFDFYRETTKVPEQALTEADIVSLCLVYLVLFLLSGAPACSWPQDNLPGLELSGAAPSKRHCLLFSQSYQEHRHQAGSKRLRFPPL